EKRTYLDRLTGERFEGTILGVTENGLLRIGTAGGDEKHFGFKEIGYLQ
ncbi:MAG: biotin--[acetyl-CoA-carboxylase] ligase, partial [Bacteroidales bacterium]|nr:biotin--[acetyl-CoA-carboxylase] ligase [Bacteroidales bacterium]